MWPQIGDPWCMTSIGSCVPDLVTVMKECQFHWNVDQLDNTSDYMLFIWNLVDEKISEGKIDLFHWRHLFQTLHKLLMFFLVCAPSILQSDTLLCFHYVSHHNMTIYFWVNDETQSSSYNYQQMAQFPKLYIETRPSLSCL